MFSKEVDIAKVHEFVCIINEGIFSSSRTAPESLDAAHTYSAWTVYPACDVKLGVQGQSCRDIRSGNREYISSMIE